VTDEGKKDTEPWIEKKGVKYAYAYDKGGKLKGKLGVGGIPHAFLVDPTGTIVWEGHPGELQPAEIEKALNGALTKPMWEWPASAKGVRASIQKHKYADALSGAEKLSEADQGPVIKAAIQAIIASRVKSMKTALEAGDFLTAEDAATELQAALAGLPEQAEAKTVGETIKANKETPAIIRALKSIRAAKAEDYHSSKQFEKGIDTMKKIAKDLPGTYAEKAAKDFQQDLEKMRRQKP
jgi:hypothetical protein